MTEVKIYERYVDDDGNLIVRGEVDGYSVVAAGHDHWMRHYWNDESPVDPDPANMKRPPHERRKVTRPMTEDEARSYAEHLLVERAGLLPQYQAPKRTLAVDIPLDEEPSEPDMPAHVAALVQGAPRHVREQVAAAFLSEQQRVQEAVEQATAAQADLHQKLVAVQELGTRVLQLEKKLAAAEETS